MKLSALGEFAFIERIRKKVERKDPDLVVGIGDDAAVLRSGGNLFTLFTTDMLIENVHFTRNLMTFSQIGEKAIAVNLSDIAAMGGRPRFAVVSLGLPEDLTVEEAEQLVAGMESLASRHGVAIVGGDTTLSLSGIVINVSMLGEVEPEHLALRSRAQVGDAVLVTGDLGRSTAYRLTGRYLPVAPRMEEARWLVTNARVHAMIDLSDGLAGDISRICEASDVGAELELASLPIAEETQELALKNGLAPRALAMSGGEDFELLFTISAADVTDFLKAARRQLPVPVTRIGRMKEAANGITVIDEKLGSRPLEEKGYEHFRQSA